MGSIEKLLGIAAVGTSMVKTQLMQRFVGNLASIITLAIATGLMAGAFLIGGFYVAYQGLIHYGLEPLAAQVLISGLGVIVLAVLIGMTASRLRTIRTIPEQIIHAEFPLASRFNGITDSFLDGLLHNTGK